MSNENDSVTWFWIFGNINVSDAYYYTMDCRCTMDSHRWWLWWWWFSIFAIGWCWHFRNSCSQGTIFLPGNKVLEHPCNEESPGKFLFEVVPGKIIFLVWLNYSYFMLMKVRTGQTDFVFLESWPRTLIWGIKCLIRLVFTQIMLPGLYTDTNEHRNTYMWQHDYWTFTCSQDCRADQKSWHSICKWLLEAILLLQYSFKIKFGKILQEECIVQLIYCHNFVTKLYRKIKSLCYKNKTKTSSMTEKTLQFCTSALLPSNTSTYLAYSVEDISAKSSILQLNFFDICSLFPSHRHLSVSEYLFST